MDPRELAAALTADGHRPGDALGLAVTGQGLALALDGRSYPAPTAAPGPLLAVLDAALRPRWVWWSARGTLAAVLAGEPTLRLGRCWDLAAVHRLLQGGSADDPSRVWAFAHGLGETGLPRPGELDLLSALSDDVAGGRAGEGRDPEGPVRADGHLDPDWASGGWTTDLGRAGRWALLALTAGRRQEKLLAEAGCGGNPRSTAWSESAAALLAEELAVEGLPVDVPTAERVLAEHVGPRPTGPSEAARLRRERDRAVLDLVPGSGSVDLRSPAQVRELLARVGLEVPDTRSWRLERVRDAHPVVDALLRWREDDRYDTTYGYRWLDTHVDGRRLRGTWSASDGGAGRMTASAGLHSLPAALRVAVRAEPGHLLVRADLGQVEPRVLAAVSGDPGLARAADAPDLYAPVARALGCDRAVAKVAVLAAMYGQTSGAAGRALQDMEQAYPTAMAYLRDAQEAGLRGGGVRTHGGRRVRAWEVADVPPEAEAHTRAAHRAAVAARGRYTRNAVVQGAAAELFKAWAATVRLRLAASGAGTVVLCLHDELLLHVRADVAADVAEDVHASLDETAARWTGPGRRPVRFVADVAVVECWSDAKS